MTFQEFIEQIIDINEKDWNAVDIKFHNVCYKKGDIINKEGDVFRNIYFINTGIVRSYFTDNEGRDFTWYIHYSSDQANMKNLFVVDYASFIKQEPSKLFFEVIEDTKLLSISYNSIQKLYNLSAKWQEFGRLMADEGYYHIHHRTMSLLTENATKRYERLLEENPNLLQIVPQYYIASYLGITPQSLSRIRKKYGK